MPRRLPDDLVAALEALEAERINNALDKLRQHPCCIEEAQALGGAIGRRLSLEIGSALTRTEDLLLPWDLEQALTSAIRFVPPSTVDLDHVCDLAAVLVEEVDLARRVVRTLPFDLEGMVADTLPEYPFRAAQALNSSTGSEFARHLVINVSQLSNSRSRRALESMNSKLGTQPLETFLASLLIGRWWQVVVVAWAISVTDLEFPM